MAHAMPNTGIARRTGGKSFDNEVHYRLAQGQSLRSISLYLSSNVNDQHRTTHKYQA
jgi:hypothetical protein